MLEEHARGRGTRGQLAARRDANGGGPAAGMLRMAGAGGASDQRVIHLACGADFTLLVTIHGDVWACGANELGQCGVITSMTYAEKPMPCLVGLHVTKLSCGDAHTAAITADGRLFCWGDNSMGQCGVGHNRPMNGVVQPVRFDQKACRQYHPEEVPLPPEPDDPKTDQEAAAAVAGVLAQEAALAWRRRWHGSGGEQGGGATPR